ncbi:MAG: hypothetical protein R3F60_10400 [bacterium]
MVYVVGGLTALLGIIAELAHVELLINMGLGWITVGVGAVFGVLGFFVGKRSMIALGLATGLLLVDTVLTLMATIGSGRIASGGSSCASSCSSRCSGVQRHQGAEGGRLPQGSGGRVLAGC